MIKKINFIQSLSPKNQEWYRKLIIILGISCAWLLIMIGAVHGTQLYYWLTLQKKSHALMQEITALQAAEQEYHEKLAIEKMLREQLAKLSKQRYHPKNPADLLATIKESMSNDQEIIAIAQKKKKIEITLNASSLNDAFAFLDHLKKTKKLSELQLISAHKKNETSKMAAVFQAIIV